MLLLCQISEAHNPSSPGTILWASANIQTVIKIFPKTARTFLQTRNIYRDIRTVVSFRKLVAFSQNLYNFSSMDSSWMIRNVSEKF